MPRKYLKQELEIRAGEKEIFVYDKHEELIRVHTRSYTPKDWVVIPSDMPKECGDYGYWNVPSFLKKAADIGPNTRIVIDSVIKKFDFPVQSFRSCFGILRFAEKYSGETLERCCRDAITAGKCNYSYIANTITSYDHAAAPAPVSKGIRSADLKPRRPKAVTGIYKDDDSRYSLSSLLSRQEGGEGR